VTAVSAGVIAVALVALIAALLLVLRRLMTVSDRVEHLITVVDRDARPALESVRRTADEASRVAGVVRSEAEAYAGTSRRLRGRVEKFADSLEERLLEFETLLDVLQEELEATVLDVAAVLRTTRRGSGVLQAVKRAVLGRRG
jgi:uncharacterized protein YoxC